MKILNPELLPCDYLFHSFVNHITAWRASEGIQKWEYTCVDLLTPPTSLMERAKKVKKESDRNVLTSSTHVSSQLYSYGTNSQRKLCDDTLHAE